MRLEAFVALTLICGAATSCGADSQAAAIKPSEPTEISLEELMKIEIPVVQAASKYEQKITEAPSSVTIITSDEVKRYGYRTLAEILQSAPGLYGSYDRAYETLGVRGINVGGYNSRVLLLVDGHRINNSLSDGAAVGNDFILDVDLIDRVEVIRGPGSSLYGNNAFLGVINVITRRGRDIGGHGLEGSAEAGSFDTFKGRVSYGNKFDNGLELLLSGSLYDSRGQDDLFYKEFNTPANNDGIAQDKDWENYKSTFGSVSFHDFSLEGGYIAHEKGIPTAPNFTVFNDSRSHTTDDRGFADLKFEHNFQEAGVVMARVYYDRNNFDEFYPYAPPNPSYEETQVGEWWGVEAQATQHFWDRLILTLGAEYRDDFRQEYTIVNVNNGMPATQVHTNRQNYGVYLEGDFAVVTNLHLNAGFRYDQYGDFDPAYNPRVAAIYNPFGQSVFKAIYGEAFRAPNLFELRHIPGAPGPDPETIKTYELVYEQGIGDHLRSSVDGFYNDIHDLITFENGFYQNIDQVKTKGVELALEGFWPSGLRGRASYTYQNTEDEEPGTLVFDSPHNLAKLNVSVPLLKDKIFGGVEVQYVSKRTSSHLGTAVAGEDAGDYAIMNLTLFSQRLVKGLEFSGSVYNVLDRHYSDPSPQVPGRPTQQDIIEQDGRTFRLKLTYRF